MFIIEEKRIISLLSYLAENDPGGLGISKLGLLHKKAIPIGMAFFHALEDNNAVFNLCCRLCSAYEHKAFLNGLQYGAHLMIELK